MSRTLLLSDIHHRHARAQSIIDKVPHDELVLLGDYFDNYNDTVQEAVDTAVWLTEKILGKPNTVAMIGNHCASYIFPQNHYFRCSGYSDQKSYAINKVLTHEHKEHFKVYHITQGYVCSHAGLTNQKWKEYSSKFEKKPDQTQLEFFDEVMSYFVQHDLKRARYNEDAELFAAGWDRGGSHRNGGMTWVDWRNLAPINGINQIVGHSTHAIPEILIQKEGGALSKKDVIEHYKLQSKLTAAKIGDSKYLSVSYNLDTNSNHYMVIEDGVVNIFDSQNHINLKELGNYYIPNNPMNTLS
jgi:hypothetical protein